MKVDDKVIVSNADSGYFCNKGIIVGFVEDTPLNCDILLESGEIMFFAENELQLYKESDDE